jgi:hypothetical protein
MATAAGPAMLRGDGLADKVNTAVIFAGLEWRVSALHEAGLPVKYCFS